MRPTEKITPTPGRGFKGSPPGGQIRQPGSHIPIPVRRGTGKRKKEKDPPDSIPMSPQPLNEILKTIRPPRDNRQSLDKGNANRVVDLGKSPSLKDSSGAKESFLPRKLRGSKKDSFKKTASQESKNTQSSQQRIKNDSCSVIFRHSRKICTEAIPNGCNQTCEKFREQPEEAFCDSNNIRNSNIESENNSYEQTDVLLSDVEYRGSYEKDLNVLSGESSENNDNSLVHRPPVTDDTEECSECRETKSCFQNSDVDVLQCMVREVLVIDQEDKKPTCDVNCPNIWEEFQNEGREDWEGNPSDSTPTEEKCCLGSFSSPSEKEQSLSIDDDTSDSGDFGNPGSFGIVQQEQYRKEETSSTAQHFQGTDLEKESLREEVSRLHHIIDEERQRARQLLQRAQKGERGMELNETLRSDLQREKTLRHEAEARLKEALCETERCKVELASLQKSVKAKDDANILLRAESSFAILKHGAPSHESKLRRYQNRIAALEKENLMLLNELKSLQPPKVFDPKDHESAICRILTKRLEVLGQENSALTGENEQQRAQYEQCLDQVANQVVQTLLVQKKLEGDCKRLRSRVQELDEENKMLSQVVNDRLRRSHNQMGPIPPCQEELTYQNCLSSHHSKPYSGNSSIVKPAVETRVGRVRPRYDDGEGQECKIRNDLPGSVNRDAPFTRTVKESCKTLHCLDAGSPDSGDGDTQVLVVNPFRSDGGRLDYTSRSDSSEKTDTEKECFVSIPASGSSPKQAAGKRGSLQKNKNYSQLPKHTGVKVAQGYGVLNNGTRFQTVDPKRRCAKGNQSQSGDAVPSQIPAKWQKVVLANKDIECDVRRKRGSSKHGARPKSHQVIPGGEESMFVLLHAAVDNSTLPDKSYYSCHAVDRDRLHKSIVMRDMLGTATRRVVSDSTTSSTLFSPLPESESSLSVEDGVGLKHKDEGYSTMSSDQQTDGLETRPEAEDDSRHPYHPSETANESITECIDGSMSSSSDSGLGPLQYLAELSLNSSEVSEDGDEVPFVSPRQGRRAVVLGALACRSAARTNRELVVVSPRAEDTLSSADTIPSTISFTTTRFPSDDRVHTDDYGGDSGSSSPWSRYGKDFLFLCDQKMQTAEKATLTEPEEQWRQKAAAWSLDDSTWTLSASSSTTSCSSRGVGEKGRTAPMSPVNSYCKFPSTDSSSETDATCWRRPPAADNAIISDTSVYLVEKSSETPQKDSPNSTNSSGSNCFQVAKHLLCRCAHRSEDQRFSNNLERVSSDSVLYLKDLFRNLESSMEPGLHAVKGRMDLHILQHSPPSSSSSRTPPEHLNSSPDRVVVGGQTERSRNWPGSQPFAQDAPRPDQEDDRSPTTSLSSVYSSSSCQVATDEDEMGLGSVKCSRDPDLSSETDNEYDIEHKTFVEQWLQKEVCQPVPELQVNQGDTIWRFSMLNEETRCFSNDELRSRGQRESRASQNLYASTCDLRGCAEDSGLQHLKDQGSSGKVQIVKPFSRTPSFKDSSCHQVELRGPPVPCRDPLPPGVAHKGPVHPSEASAVNGQSSIYRGFNRKYGSMTDVRSFGVATRMPLSSRALSNEGSSEEECVSECLQPAVKEFNSDFYKLCTVDSARSLMTSSRSLTTSDSSSQTEAEYIVQMESVSTDGNCAHSSTSDSDDCCCSRLLPPDRSFTSPVYRRVCLADGRSPKRKNLKIRKAPRRKSELGYYGVAQGLEQDDTVSECQPCEEDDTVATENTHCASGDDLPDEDDVVPEFGDGPCEVVVVHDGHQEAQFASPSSSGSRLKVCVNKMRRLGSSWRRRHLWKKEKYTRGWRGKEGYETAWVHLQADVDFNDPQACAMLLDSVAGSSSSEEDARLGSPERRGASHPRRHKHKAFSERRARASLPPQRTQQSDRENRLSYPVLSEDRQRAPLVVANDISAATESPYCPRDPEEGAPQQERVRGRKSRGPCCASMSAVTVLAEDCPGGVCWDRSAMVNSLQDDLVDHVSFSDSCAESYTSSLDSMQGVS